MGHTGNIFNDGIRFFATVGPCCQIQSPGGEIFHQRPDLPGIDGNVQALSCCLDLFQLGNEIRAGDVNFDGRITASDARLALRCAAKLDTLPESAFLAADVDIDGKVTATDARKILRVAANLDSF